MSRVRAVPISRHDRPVIWLLALFALVLVLLVLLAGCGEDTNDAPRGTNDTAPADVIAFPDGFANVARKCDYKTMVYSSTNGGGTADNEAATHSAIAVVPNDPRCIAKVEGTGVGHDR